MIHDIRCDFFFLLRDSVALCEKKRVLTRRPEGGFYEGPQALNGMVVTKCDHLHRLKFSPVLPYAFTEHGALMAASVLHSQQAVDMSIFVVRAFVKMREQLLDRSEMEMRLAAIEKGLLAHDAALRDLYRKIRPLLLPPPPTRPARKLVFTSRIVAQHTASGASRQRRKVLPARNRHRRRGRDRGRGISNHEEHEERKGSGRNRARNRNPNLDYEHDYDYESSQSSAFKWREAQVGRAVPASRWA